MVEKEHIIQQAARMFSTYGIKAVRMDDIAHELGVSKRTLYELFGDKEQLIYDAMMHLYAAKRAEHTKICQNAENILEALFMVLDQIMRESAIHERMNANLRKFYPKVFERVKAVGIERTNQGMRQLIEKGIEEGFFVGWMNLDLTISIIYVAAHNLKGEDERLLIPEGMTERETFMQLVTTLFRGISTNKGRELIDKYAEKYGNEKH